MMIVDVVFRSHHANVVVESVVVVVYRSCTGRQGLTADDRTATSWLKLDIEDKFPVDRHASQRCRG